jgi:translation machinery-associated protein 16
MDISNDENVIQTDLNFQTKTFLTIQDIHSLIDIYFHRFDDEIDQIKTKNSIGKRTVGQHFSREKAIEMTLETEKNEYESCGISIILKYFDNFM